MIDMIKLKAEPICVALEQLQKQGAEFEEVLEQAVLLLHDANPRFDWTGIYDLHPDNTLRLGPFVGEPSEHVVITVGHGVCGTAIARQCNMNIPDVSKATNYLACSSATKSELVVLIRNDERIFAQVDIDSHELDAFCDESVHEVEILADWLAVAYEQHANSIRMQSIPVEA
jgi:L-methionine (R)-S-oxide reductase